MLELVRLEELDGEKESEGDAVHLDEEGHEECGDQAVLAPVGLPAVRERDEERNEEDDVEQHEVPFPCHRDLVHVSGEVVMDMTNKLVRARERPEQQDREDEASGEVTA